VEETRAARHCASASSYSEDGSVQNVTVIDGDPLMAKSAANALKKWRYKPTMVNGEPVDVQTTIAIVFALNPVKK
jgi:protein TonB